VPGDAECCEGNRRSRYGELIHRFHGPNYFFKSVSAADAHDSAVFALGLAGTVPTYVKT
jgi:hypothetical protein